ncbi:TonB C-terminal domain-containing protein [bacterium]|nr:TonB C-terminal domain-containing protein [bacterium]
MMRDPDFVASLLNAVQKGVSPVQPLQKTLTRKRLPNYIQNALKKSSLSHLALLFFSILNLFIQSFWPTSKDEQASLSLKEQRSAIRVEVLDLPSKTLQELKKVDLSEKAVEKVKEKELPKDAMVLKKKKDAQEKKDKKKAMDEARKALSTESQRKKLMKDLLNDDDAKVAEVGREQLGGNILSEGYSITGDVATDKEVHSGKIRNHVMKFWKVPAWMAASKQYRAEVVVKLDPKGRVISRDLITKSGNDEFDRYALQSIESADPFPAPPDSLKMIYLEEGIICAFPE